MIWTFIIGMIAGWSAAFAEDRLRPHIEQHLPGRAPGPGEMRAIALAICILIGAIVAWATGSGRAVPLALGVVIGVLGPRLYDKFREMRAPDYDT